jgi:hypothetical protein
MGMEFRVVPKRENKIERFKDSKNMRYFDSSQYLIRTIRLRAMK